MAYWKIAFESTEEERKTGCDLKNIFEEVAVNPNRIFRIFLLFLSEMMLKNKKPDLTYPHGPSGEYGFSIHFESPDDILEKTPEEILMLITPERKELLLKLSNDPLNDHIHPKDEEEMKVLNSMWQEMTGENHTHWVACNGKYPGVQYTASVPPGCSNC